MASRLKSALLFALFAALAGCGGGQGAPVLVQPPVLRLSIPSASIPLGLSQQITAAEESSGGSATSLSASSLTWTSSSPAVATVSSTGVVQSVAMGTASITARLGAAAATLSIAVTDPVLLHLEITPESASIPLGDMQRFSALGVFSHATIDVSDQAEWTVVEAGIAGVTGGVALSSAIGSTTVRAAHEGKSADASLVITDGFTLALLPDTQYYAAEVFNATREMFFSQMNWTAANRESWNIRAVLSLGDIVDCPPSAKQFPIADTAYGILDAAGIPYLATLGNHDYDDICGKAGARKTSEYNRFFGPARVRHYHWYGASTYPPGKNDNHYITFEVGTRKYLAIALEFAPRDAALEWAQSVIDQHPDRYVVLATHVYMVSNVSRRALLGDFGGYPGTHEFTEPPNSGEDIWQKLVRKNRNIFLVVNGHYAGMPTRRVDTGDHGNRVVQMCVDYQNDGMGGSGRLRLLRIRHFQNSIEATSYSPYLDSHLTNDANQFTVEFSAMVSP